ncbi:hypothetical protein BDZ89DRAFT_41616 [Hymenopellis radicata]|nr:hypothetical protein BDZ89DRAFT_41616 [Hymenopellis radicata]
MRFGKYDMVSHAPNKYDIIYNKSPQRSIDVVRNSLLGNAADTTFDVVFWGKVFEAALQSGLDFLEIGIPFKEGSPTLWGKLLECAVRHHNCTASNCDRQGHEPLFSFSLGPPKDQIPLHIHRYSLEKNGTSATLRDALSTNMRPSFVKWLLQVSFPHVIRTRETQQVLESYTQDLPDDILLVLTLFQTRCIQATSSLFQHAPDDSLFYKVLDVVHEYAFGTQDCARHKYVDRATIFALQSVIESEAFGSSTVMSLADEALIIEILFSSLNRDPLARHSSWLTPTLFQKIWRVVSAAPLSDSVRKGWRVVAHVFAYVSHFTSQIGATETIYAYLLEQDWLHDIGVEYTRLARSTNPDVDGLSPHWCPGYTLIAVSYVDVLSLHTSSSSEILRKARKYMEEPAHLATLAKILLVSGCDTQRRLWLLAGMVNESNSWEDCITELSQLAACPGVGEEYAYVRILASVTIHGNREVHYRPIDELAALVATFATDIRRGHFIPPACARIECSMMKAIVPETAVMPRKQSFFEHWRRRFRHGTLKNPA